MLLLQRKCKFNSIIKRKKKIKNWILGHLRQNINDLESQNTKFMRDLDLEISKG